jgi:hypothetical protein
MTSTARLDASKWQHLTNLTPHTIHLHTQNMGISMIPSSGVARAEEIIVPLPDDEADIYFDHFEDSGMHICVPLVGKRYGNVTGLPAPQRGRLYIVSQIIIDACPDRVDLVAPHDMIRDDQGRVTGCRGFARRAAPVQDRGRFEIPG